MKHAVRFIARLYPPAWRRRYGAEFEALLEDATPSPRAAFDVLWGALKMQLTTWNSGRIMLATSIAGILVAVMISFVAPPHYLSLATLTATPANESTRRLLSTLEQNILSRENLASVIQAHNLYAHERVTMSLDDVVDKMKKNIHVNLTPPASPANALTFVVQFDYSDRYLAQQVNDDLASQFIEGNVDPRLHSHSHMVLYMPSESSLPLKPEGPNRIQLGVAGLFGGLLAGLSLALIVRARRSITVGNE